MEELMLSMQGGNKSQAVTHARAIYDKLPLFIQQAQAIMVSCTDPVIKARLEQLIAVPKNFAVQLKIIASVKAAQDDNKADKQMKSVMKQLAKSLQNVVEAGDSVTLLR
jgi:hypothetical protein